jgi:predicted O-methyltransferase YrrM
MVTTDTAGFINSLFPPLSAELDAIYAQKGGPPAIPMETARLLAVILSLLRPSNALEIGCSFGFSACLTAGYMADGGKVMTIERNAALLDTARSNFSKAGFADRITLIEGDALTVLPELCSRGLRYDYIFIDAAKGQYVNFFPHCFELLATGGVLAADNIFHKGFTTSDRKSVPRRQRTTHDRMNRFLQQISNHPQLQTSIIPIGDGLAISVKRG